MQAAPGSLGIGDLLVYLWFRENSEDYLNTRRTFMNLREGNLKQLTSCDFDIMIIGGGINGAVSAAALTARGARVALIDTRDFAGFTSQHSLYKSRIWTSRGLWNLD